MANSAKVYAKPTYIRHDNKLEANKRAGRSSNIRTHSVIPIAMVFMKSGTAYVPQSHFPSASSTRSTRPPQKNQPDSAPATTINLNADQSKLLHLQNTQGNAAVVHLLRQRSATAGPPNDPTQALPTNLSSPLQTLFGDDARRAQIHTGAQADEIARAADSEATSVGDHIYFRTSAYRPGTAKGNAMIARQMTHVAQRQSSRKASDAQQQEAEEMGDLVGTMGANPTQTLEPAADGQLTPAQHGVIQRSERSRRVGGIVVSKALQGMANLLGPLGIVFRWPLIRKNLREYGGLDKTTGKVNATNMARYGEGAWADVARVLSQTAEILKEATIWLGLGTLIAAIVTAATHGAAAPALIALTVMTATIASAAALMKLYLVGHNLVRLAMAKKDDAALPMIKHQLFIDGMDGLGNLIGAMLSIFGAASATGAIGFAASAGKEITTGIGLSGMGAPVVGKVINDTVVSPLIGMPINAVKEGGKDYTKTGSEKGFTGGFLKDYNDIKTAYKPVVPPKSTVSTPTVPTSTVPTPSTSNTVPQDDLSSQSASVSEASKQLSTISQASRRNSIDQQSERRVSTSVATTLKDRGFDDFGESIAPVSKITGDLNKVDVAVKTTDQQIDQGVSQIDEKEIKSVKKQVNEGLVKVGESPEQDDVKDGDGVVQKKGSKPSVGSRIAGWFASKLSSVKKGVRKLNGKLMMGVLKLMAKFGKNGGDLTNAAQIVNTTVQNAAENKAVEGENVALAEQYQNKSGQAVLMFEKAKQEE